MLRGCIGIELGMEVVFGIGIENVVVFEVGIGIRVENKLELEVVDVESEIAHGIETVVFPFLP